MLRRVWEYVLAWGQAKNIIQYPLWGLCGSQIYFSFKWEALLFFEASHWLKKSLARLRVRHVPPTKSRKWGSVFGPSRPPQEVVKVCLWTRETRKWFPTCPLLWLQPLGVSGDRITPIYKPWKGHLEGVPQPYLRDLLIMVINHVSESWDDPPSKRE